MGNDDFLKKLKMQHDSKQSKEQQRNNGHHQKAQSYFSSHQGSGAHG